jgi:hypothetical protein
MICRLTLDLETPTVSAISGITLPPAMEAKLTDHVWELAGLLA